MRQSYVLVEHRYNPGSIGPDAPQASGVITRNIGTQYQWFQNQPPTIGGRHFTGHAIDQVRNPGLTPTVVREVIRTGAFSNDRYSACAFLV